MTGYPNPRENKLLYVWTEIKVRKTKRLHMGKAKKNKETKLLIKDVIANETLQLHIQMFFQKLYSYLVF